MTKSGASNRAHVTLASGVVAAVVMAGSVFSFAELRKPPPGWAHLTPPLARLSLLD